MEEDIAVGKLGSNQLRNKKDDPLAPWHRPRDTLTSCQRPSTNMKNIQV